MMIVIHLSALHRCKAKNTCQHLYKSAIGTQAYAQYICVVEFYSTCHMKLKQFNIIFICMVNSGMENEKTNKQKKAANKHLCIYKKKYTIHKKYTKAGVKGAE